MALLKRDSAARDAKPRTANAAASPLARVMREFQQLVLDFECGLQRSLEDPHIAAQHSAKGWCREDIRREACRMTITDLSDRYTRKHIRRSLNAAESEGKRVEEQLHALSLSPSPDGDDELGIHNGYFRLYSTELFDLLGQPTDLRLGTLRFHKHDTSPVSDESSSAGVTVELALNKSFFVADSEETLPYHTFHFDSWLLFTFLGNGCIKLEVPIEMCAHVYGGRLRGRENEEVTFWGFFVDDDIDS